MKEQIKHSERFQARRKRYLGRIQGQQGFRCKRSKEKTKTIFFESTARGTVTNRPRGKTKKQQWSELFKIFIPENESKTLAEMTEKEFNQWKERRSESSAMTQFAEWYSSKD